MRPTLLLLPLLVSSLLQFHHHAIADCEPAACGNLTLSYPFWLGSNSLPPPPSLCGHPAFEVLCSDDDGRVASLRGSSIHVLAINYTTNSFVASHAKLAGADAVCQTDFNMSSSIALSPFTISAQNRALCFFYSCSGTAPPSGPEYANATSSCGFPIYAYLGGAYNRDRTPAIATGSCEFSYMPVLGSEAAVMTAANYSRLLKDGFVLDWEVASVGDCRACNVTGGQCRYDNVAAEFWCLCPGGRRAGSTCAELQIAVALTADALLALPISFVARWLHIEI